MEEQLHDQKASAQSAVKEESQKYRKELVCLLYSLIFCIFVFFNKEKTCLSNLLSIFKVIKYFCYAAVFLRIWFKREMVSNGIFRPKEASFVFCNEQTFYYNMSKKYGTDYHCS